MVNRLGALVALVLAVAGLVGCGGEEEEPYDPNTDPLYFATPYLTGDISLDAQARPQFHIGNSPRGQAQRLVLYRDSLGAFKAVDLNAPFDPLNGVTASPVTWFTQTNIKFDTPTTGTRWLNIAQNYVLWQSAENQLAFWNRANDPPKPADAKGARGDIFSSMCQVTVDNRAAVVYGNKLGNLVLQDLTDENRRDSDNPFYNPLERRPTIAFMCLPAAKQIIVSAGPATSAAPGTPSTLEVYSFDTEPGPRIKRPFGMAGGATAVESYTSNDMPGTIQTITASAKWLIVVNELNQIYSIERSSRTVKLISDRTTQTDPVRNVHLDGDMVAWSDNADSWQVGPDYVNIYIVDLTRPLASGAYDIQQITNDNRVQRDPLIDAETRTVYWLEKADTTKNPGAPWQIFRKKLPPPKEITAATP